MTKTVTEILRWQQTQRVMAVIGPLLDAYVAIPNDMMSALREDCPEFTTWMVALIKAVGSESK